MELHGYRKSQRFRSRRRRRYVYHNIYYSKKKKKFIFKRKYNAYAYV